MTIRKCVTVLAVAVLIVACGNDGEKDSTWLGETATATPAQHPASIGGTAVVPTASGGTTVLVMIEDGRIAIREAALPTGPAVFTITNGGDKLHDLHIEGPGVKKAAGGPIEEHGSRAVTVELQPGTYTAHCPILDHREKGELATFTVRG